MKEKDKERFSNGTLGRKEKWVDPSSPEGVQLSAKVYKTLDGHGMMPKIHQKTGTEGRLRWKPNAPQGANKITVKVLLSPLLGTYLILGLKRGGLFR